MKQTNLKTQRSRKIQRVMVWASMTSRRKMTKHVCNTVAQTITLIWESFILGVRWICGMYEIVFTVNWGKD